MNFNKVQKRRGIGTVITTLIVLIASVVLGAGVIFFGGSLFQSNTEQESIQVTNAHVWGDSTESQAAFVVKNTGGKVVSISSIQLRGTSVPTNTWFYLNDQDIMTVQNTQTELVYSTTPLADAVALTLPEVIVGGDYTLAAASGPISLKQGESAIIYLKDPASIKTTDIGIAYTMTVKAGQVSAVQSVSVASSS